MSTIMLLGPSLLKGIENPTNVLNNKKNSVLDSLIAWRYSVETQGGAPFFGT